MALDIDKATEGAWQAYLDRLGPAGRDLLDDRATFHIFQGWIHRRCGRNGEKTMNMNWQKIDTAPDKTLVDTKIDDAHGVRNECRLLRQGRLWFLPDGSMYVYYTPTHWRPFAEAPTGEW